jgi:hypothetical protein
VSRVLGINVWAKLNPGTIIVAMLPSVTCGAADPRAFIGRRAGSADSVKIVECANAGNLINFDFVVRRFHSAMCTRTRSDVDVDGADEGLTGWVVWRNPPSGISLTVCIALRPDTPSIYSPLCGGRDGKVNAFIVSNARVHLDGEWKDTGTAHYDLQQKGDAVFSSGSFGPATGKFTDAFTIQMTWATASVIGTVDRGGEIIRWNNGSAWTKVRRKDERVPCQRDTC